MLTQDEERALEVLYVSPLSGKQAFETVYSPKGLEGEVEGDHSAQSSP